MGMKWVRTQDGESRLKSENRAICRVYKTSVDGMYKADVFCFYDIYTVLLYTTDLDQAEHNAENHIIIMCDDYISEYEELRGWLEEM